GRRDLGVARRIARLMQENPTQTLIVVFGESHLASNHLPARVRAILGRKGIAPRDLVLLQNVDALYWKLQESGLVEARAVRVHEGCYCVFNATPIEKYESFRQYLNKCIEEDSCGDWTVLAQTLMEIMMNFLALDKHAASLMSLLEFDSAWAGEFELGNAAEEFARFIH